MRSEAETDPANRSIARMAIDGYVIVDELLRTDEVDRVDESLADAVVDSTGDRRFLDREWCRLLAHVVRHRLLKLRLLYRASQPVLCTYFCKDADTNGSSGLHRDLHLPLAARVDSGHFSDWTEQQDIPHARASSALLNSMLAVRLHIDDCGAGDGELYVVPGSHRAADIDAAQIRCTGTRGSAVVMSPMVLRTSPRSQSLKTRRVLYFLFGPSDLPDGARWYYDR